MVGKLRRKIPLDNQDVNTQPAKRMCLKKNILLEDLNKQNIPIEIPYLNESPQSASSSLTGVLNLHLEKQSPQRKRLSTNIETDTVLDTKKQEVLTSLKLEELQDNFKDLERRLSIQNRDYFIKDAHYSDEDLTKCRTNFLFELECLPNLSWSQKGNLRTVSYIPSVYQKLDPNWYFSQAFSIDDFTNLPESVKPFYILNPMNEVPECNNQQIEPVGPEKATVHIENIEPLSKMIPSSKLKFRAKSCAFDEDIDCQLLFKQKISDCNYYEDEVDQISLPDSLDHCRSVKKKVTDGKKSLNRNSILFHTDKRN